MTTDAVQNAVPAPAFANRSRQHSLNLDVLRSFAVLCVLASHTAETLFGYRNLGSLGRFGVILFFFHTAYVLMESLERMSARSGGWRLSLAFWTRRAFRIYPLAIVCILAALLLHVPRLAGSAVVWSAPAVVSNLLLVQNLTYQPDVIGPLWSLPLEVQMYVLLPAVFLLLRRFRVHPAAVAAASVAAALAYPHLNDRLGVLAYAPCFSAGIVAFQCAPQVRPRLPSTVWMPAVVLAALVFRPFDNIPLPAKLPMAWLLSMLLAIVYVLCRDYRPGPLTRAAHHLAEISYGIYLGHVIVLELLKHYLHVLPLQLAILFPAVAILAFALYHLVERPGIALGRMLSQRIAHRPTTAA